MTPLRTRQNRSSGPMPALLLDRAVPARVLGRSGIEISALGMGTWQIGGPTSENDRQLGWGPVDDEESVRALRRAVELGVTFFDTADSYGAGHAEQVLGRALGHRRSDLVWATKWGNTIDEANGQRTGTDHSPGYARRALQASLRRLGTDYVDAAVFARGPRCAAIEHQLDVLDNDPELVRFCETQGLASVNRSPLAMGLLTDRVTAQTVIPTGDLRHDPPAWLTWFQRGRPNPTFLAQRNAVRDVLTSDGRTLAQGALAWIWARSPVTVPIPGCRTVAEVEQNAASMAYGPLTAAQLAAIDDVLRPTTAVAA